MLHKFSLQVGAFLGLILGLIVLIYFNETTLFLVALLLSIIFVRKIGLTNEVKDVQSITDKVVGMLFALSVAPALSVTDILDFTNGFLIQALLSFTFFLLILKKQPSIIGRISREAKGAIALLGDDILAGFAAGILSSALWQAYLNFFIS